MWFSPFAYWQSIYHTRGTLLFQTLSLSKADGREHGLSMFSVIGLQCVPPQSNEKVMQSERSIFCLWELSTVCSYYDIMVHYNVIADSLSLSFSQMKWFMSSHWKSFHCPKLISPAQSSPGPWPWPQLSGCPAFQFLYSGNVPSSHLHSFSLSKSVRPIQ